MDANDQKTPVPVPLGNWLLPPDNPGKNKAVQKSAKVYFLRSSAATSRGMEY
jgi:hypothetical protein